MKIFVPKPKKIKKRKKWRQYNRYFTDKEYPKDATAEEKFELFCEYYEDLSFKFIYKKYTKSQDWKKNQTREQPIQSPVDTVQEVFPSEPAYQCHEATPR